jgi:PAS domain S-box-containing protein
MRRSRAKQTSQYPITALLLTLLTLQIAGSAQMRPTRRILILNEVGTSYPLINLIDEGIRTSLADSPYRIEFYREYMDTVLFPDPDDQRAIKDFYIRKYRNHRPDVIITLGSSPLRFMRETHRRFFSGIPVIYCYPNAPAEESTLDAEFTGVDATVAPASTIALALRLLPDTSHVVVIGGTAPYDKRQQSIVREQLRTFQNHLDISYLTDLAAPALIERLKQLPSHTVVLLTALARDSAGRSFNANDAGAMVASAANAPVFSLTDRHLNHGEVGGDVESGLEQGRIIGGMVLRLLRGDKPQDIPIIKTLPHYMFDWRVLKRWGINAKSLPAGSIVLNREPTVWESYKQYIVVGLSLILLEAVLIAGLLWQRARRREANRALHQRTTELQAREDLLKIFVQNVPAGVAMLDCDMRYLQVSERWCADYGLDASQVLGRCHYEVFPDTPDRWKQIHRRALGGETLRADEDRWDRKSAITWVRWEVRPWLNVDREPGGILIFAENITRRKQADDALLGMGRRLIESQEQERARIARELHDDINQRLALLAVELDRLDQIASTNSVRDIVQEVKRRVMEIGRDVQAISHQLHPSKLEYLGLATASKSLCREISEMHHVRIDFRQNAVPRNLSKEVGLCLFRVLQEALQNAVKYSGTDYFEVDLCGTSVDIKLRIHDSGRGFDLEDTVETTGLGLVSMRERVKLVNGEIVIESKPMEGTDITVRVPIPVAEGAREVISGVA